MPGSLHPLARSSFKTLSLPSPLAMYRLGVTERINTNPFGGVYRCYPSPCADRLRADYAALLEKSATRTGTDAHLSYENVLFTAGAIAGIDLLLRAFCEPKQDSICIQSPAFPCYEALARACDVAVRDVARTGDYLDVIDVDAVIASRAKMTFLCVPNNPTGSHLTRDTVLAIVDGSAGLVIVDEAYVELSRQPSLAAEVASHPRLVVLRSFSKAWGLAGLRAGALLAHPSVIDTLRIIQDPYSFHEAAQRAVADRIAHYDQVEQSIMRIRAERDRLVVALSGLAVVDRVFPSETNFVMVQLKSCGWESLLEADMLVSDMRDIVPNAFRISVADARHNDRVVASLAAHKRA